MAKHIRGPLYFEQLGRYGRHVVFVHPNPMDGTSWLFQMAHLSTWFRTVAVDLPGYGHSPAAEPGLTLWDMAEACWEAADSVTDEAAILVGLSVGSNVILRMASQRPERTSALVIAGSGHSSSREWVPERIAQYEAQGLAFRRPHALEDFCASYRTTPLAQYFADMFAERNGLADLTSILEIFRALREPNSDELYQNIKAPTLIITGSEDAGHAGAFALQERIQGSQLVIIEGAGHACNMEQPWEFDAALLAFLRKQGLLEH